MITLSSEKGLIRVTSWSELEERPGFVSELDPSKEKLASIIGRYIEKEKVRCGLSTCHTPHNRGYIVKRGGPIYLDSQTHTKDSRTNSVFRKVHLSFRDNQNERHTG